MGTEKEKEEEEREEQDEEMELILGRRTEDLAFVFVYRYGPLVRIEDGPLVRRENSRRYFK